LSTIAVSLWKCCPTIKNKKPRAKGRCFITTDTPEKHFLEKKVLEKERKEEPKEPDSDNGKEESISIHDELSDYDVNEDIDVLLENNKRNPDESPEVYPYPNKWKRCFCTGKIIEESSRLRYEFRKVEVY
jgi:hypothetical protein